MPKKLSILDVQAAFLVQASQYETEMVGVISPEVYVNFDFSQAVVVSLDTDNDCPVYSATAYAWDRTHGVSAELWLLHTDLIEVLVPAVLAWIKQQEEAEARMEALFEQEENKQ